MQLNPVYVVLIGGSLAAVYLVTKQREREEFDAPSYVAGWVTPGPLTVAAAVGLIIYFVR